MNNSTQLSKTWPDYISMVQPRFEAISKDNNQAVKWREESYFALQAIKVNQTLAQCVPETVQAAIVNVAAVGLTLNPADGYAYLVPEYNKDTGRKECQLRISFRGLVKSATDTGAISWVKAEIVKSGDRFDYKGPCALPCHIMNPFNQDRGDSIGVYCVAKTIDGDYLVDIMPWDEVMKIKDCAKTKKVWDKWPDEMAKKAIIKRASKQWPKTEKSKTLHKAIEVVNELEGSYEVDTEKQEKYTELISNDDALGYWMFLRDNENDLISDLHRMHINNIPKGQGRMAEKKKLKDLELQGESAFLLVREAINANDSSMLAELIEDVSQETKDSLMKRLNEHEISVFNELEGSL